jgi:predicted DNA-binding transcriptional regulator
MATIFGGAERATAGNHAISAHKAFLKKDYETAFESLLAIRSVYPQSSFLTAYYDKTQKLLIDTQLVKVDALIVANKLPGLIDAFEKLGKLSKAAQGNADVIAKIEQRNHKLRTLVATSLIRRAADLKKQDAMVYSSLILRNLRLARQFDPQQLVAFEEDAAKAQGITSRKTEMKVLVAYDGSAGIPQEWAKRLESDVFSALESSGVPGLNIVDRVSLKGGNARVPGVVDLAISGSIDAVDFSEKGRDAPRRRSSKYISGTRQIDNPAYPLAETAYHEAEAAYNSTKTAQENLKRECRRLDGAMARMICEAGVSYVSSSFKDNAYAKWKSTPQYLTQNIISSYQYDHYTVTLNGLVRSKCALLDNLSRAESKCTAINEKFKREGTIIANAQSTDTEGIRNAVEAPDMVNELENAYEQVVKSISAELVQMVSAQRAGRYCKLAESLKKPSDKLKSLEAASMCAFIIGDEDDKRRAGLDEKLNAYLMISPAQVQAFGSQNKEQDAAWPTPSEVDDNDLKLAMMKMGVSR